MSGEATGTTQEPRAAVVLEDVNKVLTQLLPVVGLSMTTVRMLVALLQRNGVDIGPFQQEIATYETSLAGLSAATSAFRQKYGYADGLTGTENAGGPAPGESTTIGS